MRHYDIAVNGNRQNLQCDNILEIGDLADHWHSRGYTIDVIVYDDDIEVGSINYKGSIQAMYVKVYARYGMGNKEGQIK